VSLTEPVLGSREPNLGLDGRPRLNRDTEFMGVPGGILSSVEPDPGVLAPNAAREDSFEKSSARVFSEGLLQTQWTLPPSMTGMRSSVPRWPDSVSSWAASLSSTLTVRRRRDEGVGRGTCAALPGSWQSSARALPNESTPLSMYLATSLATK
jgi:hypothetical protein